MPKIDLFPQPLQVDKEIQRRSCLIRETTIEGESIEKELWFIYPAGLSMLVDDACDPYLLSILLPAMQLKSDICVHGSVSRELLANLTELQYIWAKWCPEHYFLVNIEVDLIREDDIQVDGAIVAFSGGVDAQFTAYRHATRKAGYGTQDLRAGIMVHGFDIPLIDVKGFAGATKMASDVLDDLDLPLISVKTNIRALWTINWEHYCGIAIASVLSGLSKHAGVGLIGSGDSYDTLITPWGSHPMTDPLLSSDSFKIIHDGAGFNRLEKIKFISGWEAGVRNLRVCWAGDKYDRNCGHCEKCIRTRLLFLIVGNKEPECFHEPLRKEHFRFIVLNEHFIIMDWKFIRNEMIEARRGVKWLPQIEKVIKRKPSPRLGVVFPIGSRRRMWVKKIKSKAVKGRYK